MDQDNGKAQASVGTVLKRAARSATRLDGKTRVSARRATHASELWTRCAYRSVSRTYVDVQDTVAPNSDGAVAGLDEPEDAALESDDEPDDDDEEEAEEEECEGDGTGEETAPAVVPAAPTARAPRTRYSYSYPWPQGRQPEEGPPRYRSHTDCIHAANLVEAQERVTHKEQEARVHGVNFKTCLTLLPYWDVVQCFALDILHDIYLGPTKNLLEQTFGNAKLADTHATNKALKLRLPRSVGKLLSKAYTDLQNQMPAERNIKLKAPHKKHHFFKGMFS